MSWASRNKRLWAGSETDWLGCDKPPWSGWQLGCIKRGVSGGKVSGTRALGGQHDMRLPLHCFQARSNTFNCSSDPSGRFASKRWKSRDAISVFSSRWGLLRKQAAKQHTKTCQFGKWGFSALYQRQGGTVSSFLVLAIFVKRNGPLHTMCFPFGLGLCPKGPISSKPS